MRKGPPLLECPPGTRRPPEYKLLKNGYPSCVVPRPANAAHPKANGKPVDHEKVVHPVLGGPQPYHVEPLVTGRSLACCVCGLLLAALLLYMLYEYVREQTELQVPEHIDVDNVELYNAIYTHRVADIIRAAQTETWRGGGADVGVWRVTDNPVHVAGPGVGQMGLLSGGEGQRLHVPQVRRTERQLCDDIPAILWGNVSGDVNKEHETLTMSQLMLWHPDLMPGGEWRPLECVARYRLAVIIPYRDRLAHLTVLLAHLLPILKRQQLHFRIFVVEQEGNLTFNKGRIMNAAFKEALKMFNVQCAVFHDVDLIPEDDRNMYTCPVMPRHMSVAIDEMNYRLAYGYLVGGVLNMRVEHFQKVNGYSNMYWGWGAEDDDMAYRILHEGLKIFRPPSNIARYQMIKHKKRKPTSWRIRERLLRTAVKRYHLDGLNSVQYTVQFIHSDPLYTHIMVNIGKPDIKTER